MNVVFKIADYFDIEEIVKLCNECFEENTLVIDAQRNFLKTKSDKNQIYLIGIVDGLIVAHTKITIIPMFFDKVRTYAILNHVCVKKEYRRHNIATKMLIECERICKGLDCNEMKLWSMNFRIPAHECYKNFGFEINDAKFFSKKID